MIIKTYGEFWSRSRVDWPSRRLPGVRKGKRHCDIWDQRGIYALYQDFKIVYVGQADSRGIGVRLNEHRADRFSERWNSFSFFGICDTDEHGKAKPAGQVTVGPTSVIKSLELMAILLSDAPLNRARGRFPDGAEKVWQIELKQKSKLHDIDTELSTMVSAIEKMRMSLGAKNRRVKNIQD